MIIKIQSNLNEVSKAMLGWKFILYLLYVLEKKAEKQHFK